MDGHVLHFCLHPHNIVFVRGIDPFFGCLGDFILYLPLSGLGFTACRDVLNVGHNTIHDRGLAAVCGWALGSVVTGLVTLKVGNCGRVTGVSLIRV